MEKSLAAHEKIRITAEGLVGFSKNMEFQVEVAACCSSQCFGGECCYNVLTGPGKVYMQSMSFQKFKRVISPPKEKDDDDDGDKNKD